MVAVVAMYQCIDKRCYYDAQADDGLQANDKRIYELIARHFLACCSQNAEVRGLERYSCFVLLHNSWLFCTWTFRATRQR